MSRSRYRYAVYFSSETTEEMWGDSKKEDCIQIGNGPIEVSGIMIIILKKDAERLRILGYAEESWQLSTRISSYETVALTAFHMPAACLLDLRWARLWLVISAVIVGPVAIPSWESAEVACDVSRYDVDLSPAPGELELPFVLHPRSGSSGSSRLRPLELESRM